MFIEQIQIFGTAFVWAIVISTQTVFMARKQLLCVFITSFAISAGWALILKLIIAHLQQLWFAYALGMACGSVIGTWFGHWFKIKRRK